MPRAALREISLDQTLKGISKEEAYALSSFAVDLHVTQTVNNVKGVHAMIDRSIVGSRHDACFAGSRPRPRTSVLRYSARSLIDATSDKGPR